MQVGKKALHMDDEKKVDIENVRTEYKEVCQSYRSVADFRGKLLTLLPLASGAGIYLLISKQGTPDLLAPEYLVAIGVFGMMVTLGLFLHELREIETCGDLIKIGRSLEERMGLSEGQFIRADNYYHRQKSRLRTFRNNLTSAVGAAWTIYPSVGIAWLIVAVLGVARFPGVVR